MLVVKNASASAGDARNLGSILGSVGKFPWRRVWLSTLVFLPEKSNGQRKLEGLQSMGQQIQT